MVSGFSFIAPLPPVERGPRSAGCPQEPADPPTLRRTPAGITGRMPGLAGAARPGTAGRPRERLDEASGTVRLGAPLDPVGPQSRRAALWPLRREGPKRSRVRSFARVAVKLGGTARPRR